MAMVVTDWAKYEWDAMLQFSLKEANVLGSPSDVSDYRYAPGSDGRLIRKLTARSVTHRADGTLLETASSTQGKVLITLDEPLAIHDYVEYSTINRNGGGISKDMGRDFGNQLQEKIQNVFLAYVAKVASGDTSGSLTGGTDVRNDGDGAFAFDNEDATAASLVTAIEEADSQLSVDLHPTAGRICLLHPTHYTRLRKVAHIASTYFNGPGTPSNNNAATFSSFQWGHIRFVNMVSWFGQDKSGDTSIAAKYRTNLAANGILPGPVLGVLFQRNAIAWEEVESPRGLIDDMPQNSGWLVQARTQFGLGTKHVTGAVCLYGDDNS